MNTPNTSQIKSTQSKLTETREVHGFERISLTVQNIQNDLVIRQGQSESLLIEADPDLLSRIKTEVKNGELLIKLTGSWSDLVKEALATSLTRQRIKYTLTVKHISALGIEGIVHVDAASLETDRLALRFKGPGKAHFTSLQAKLLEVDIAGPCKVELAGKVVEQRLAITAIGFYYAPKLESQKAVVRLNGPGQATLWVTDNLDAAISGPGRLEYYGAPKVRRSGFPFADLVSLGIP